MRRSAHLFYHTTDPVIFHLFFLISRGIDKTPDDAFVIRGFSGSGKYKTKTAMDLYSSSSRDLLCSMIAALSEADRFAGSISHSQAASDILRPF